jgi:DNA-binding IclR family transcriptional regulator
MLESSKVPALTRAIDILNLIARIGPCSAATIIDELGIPKSTAYLLLGELKKQRFLSMDNQDNYCLWTKLVELAGQALSKMDLRELARPRLTQLMDQCGLLCHLGIIDSGNAYYILKIESPATISVRSHEGKSLSFIAPALVNACWPGSPSGFRSRLSASCSGSGRRQPPSPAPNSFAMSWAVFAPAAGASITAKTIPTFAAWPRRCLTPITS